MNFNWTHKNVIETKFIDRINGKNQTKKIKVRVWEKRKERRRRKIKKN